MINETMIIEPSKNIDIIKKTYSQDLHSKLSAIQAGLSAPKGQTNAFGKYKYRSCEDILQAIKPKLNGLVLTVSDDLVEMGGRVYIKATATIGNEEHTIRNTAYAKEPLAQKGMSDPQITGSTSSYARKYALNGLFCIDDNKDPDSLDKNGGSANEVIVAVGQDPSSAIDKINMIENIKTIAGSICKGKSSEDKIKFMHSNICKQGFPGLKTKTLNELTGVWENLKDFQ